MSIRKLLRVASLTLSLLGSGSLVMSTPAFAAQTYGTPSSFGSAGSGAGQFALAPGSVYGYGQHSGSSVTVNDTTHDVYVTDTGNARIDEFDQNGNFIRAWGYGVADGTTEALQTCTVTCFAGIAGGGEGQFVEPVAIAVDNSGTSSNEDVYVADITVTGLEGYGRIEKFTSTGAYLATIPLSEREGGRSFMGLAVDTNGKVWLAEIENGLRVDEFDASGGLITAWKDPSNADPGLAVDLSENVYADTGYNGGAITAFLTKYNNVGENLGFPSNCCSDGLAFDTATGELFADNETSVTQFDSSGNVIRQFGSGSLSSGQGIAVDPGTGTVYVADSTKGVIEAFPVVTLPDVSVLPPSEVKRTSVTLHGTVKPDGIDANGLRFEYGLTNAYGTSEATSPPACPATETECPVTVNLTGLKLETTYHYRLDASNVNGTNNSQDVTFTTAPAVSGVSSGSASNVTPTSATITGSLEPEGLETHYYCQYGFDTAYGLTSPAPPGSETRAASGSPATCALSALQPRRTYHFRLVATNSYGTTVGADQTLVTPSAPPSVDRQLTSVVRQTSAIMDAAVNANNEDTTYHFEYGSTASYGTSFASSDIGSAYGDVNVGQSLAGLLPAGTYHFRVVATNATGTSYGADQTFVTPSVAPPVVSTGAVSGVSANEASVSGTVDPEGFQTAYEFDLGTDTGYGTRVSADAGAGFEAESMTLSLQGLAPGTTYHYRLVATNVWGTAYGADESFTTPGVPSASLTAPIAAVLVAVPAGVFPGQATAVTPKTGKPKAKGKPKKKKRAKKKSKGAKRRHG
jgi:phosphodiesterase/alkaline phosphatase D-like protein